MVNKISLKWWSSAHWEWEWEYRGNIPKKDKIRLGEKRLVEETQHNYYSYHDTATSPNYI